MANCAQCGKEERWYRPLHVSGGPNHSLAFCNNSCKMAWLREQKKAKKEAKEAWLEQERRAEEARLEEERRAEEARQRELEEKKRPFIEAIAASPTDPTGYLELANLLLAKAELTGFSGEAAWHGLAENIFWLSDTGTIKEHSLRVLSDTITAPEGSIPHSLKHLFGEAAEHYLKAIALGISDPFTSGRAKLTYGFLLALTQRGNSAHYGREAEKDLRKHLRAHAEDAKALVMLWLAIGLGPGSDTSKEERLAAISARIEEVAVRRELGASPLSSIRPPGEPEPPYPENWSRLAEQVKRRDGYRCSECGASGVELHAHHIVPLLSGGSNDLDNLTTLCSYCHGQIHPRMGDGRV